MDHPGGALVGATNRAALPLTNLLNDIDTLGPLLVDRIAAGDLLNAFLLAAGMGQIAEDHLHRDPFYLRRAASRMKRRIPAPWGWIGATAARGAGDLIWHGVTKTPGHRACAAWLGGMERLGQRLAIRVAELSDEAEPSLGADLEVEARQLVAEVPGLPASLRRSLLRLPSCFRSFDQTPEDVEALAASFARRWPELDLPILVVGIRTSGCYLAPLAAASLRRLGFKDVRVASLRPGQRWLRREARLVQQAAEAGGLAVVMDDPPRSWGSVISVARELADLGFADDRIVLLLATFDNAALPPAPLHSHPAVLLPFADWAIRRRLQSESVRESLVRILAEQAEVLAVRQLDSAPDGTARGHLQAVYEVETRSGGKTSRCLVQARGVGLGYFGEHALAVAARLPGRITHVHGLDGGVLFVDWPLPASRLCAPLGERSAAAIAAYVAERARALPLPEDLTRRLRYRGATWQWAGPALGGLFGRASELGRLLGARVARRLLTVGWPAVIDNRTHLDAFAEAPSGEGLVKSEFDVGVFGSDDLYCFDPVADLALASMNGDATTGDRLRHAYEEATGRLVEPEPWLLYQLVHLLASHEKEPASSRHTDLRPARLLLHYYREVLLADLEPATSGPLCAIDLDGVLETMPLGFPATSPAGALALRALNRHGYRPVVATGRSLDEVRDRCAAYGLAGGVAEYGAVVYFHGSGEVRSLLEPAEREALESLRTVLGEADDVHLDPAYRHSIRAFRLDDRGQRWGLSDERSARALAASAKGRLQSVRGHYQTDFVVAGTGKARGLRVLSDELCASDEIPLALAVGDTASDIEMLRMAQLGIAPGNADLALRGAAGVKVIRPSAQAGLAEAVARLVGHRPGGCPLCAAPGVTRSSRLLLDLLAVPDVARWRQAARVVRLLLASRETA